jgi:TonB family protein
VFCWLGTSFAQEEQAVCPKHIEAPVYPQVALSAHVTGTVTLTLTIDMDGKVKDVRANTDAPLLKRNTVDNIRKWIFSKPPSAPYTHKIVYTYQIDESRRIRGTNVSFDLPDHVTILTEPKPMNLDPSAVAPLTNRVPE